MPKWRRPDFSASRTLPPDRRAALNGDRARVRYLLERGQSWNTFA